MVICLERGADLHMAYMGSPGKRAVERLFVCVIALHFVALSQPSDAVCVLYEGQLQQPVYSRHSGWLCGPAVILAASHRPANVPQHVRWAHLLATSSTVSTGRSLQPRHQTVTNTHTRPFNGPLSGATRVSRYQKGKTNLDFIEARDSEWQWHQLGHMQVYTSLQTDNHASTPPPTTQFFYRPDALPAAQPTASKH